jgi:hypothetical protein
LEFWRCAASSSADLEVTVLAAPMFAVAYKSVWLNVMQA